MSTEHLYLHVPFCARRCTYCDFSIAVRRDVPWRAFADAIDRECTIRGIAQQAGVLATVYLGGGTPSRLGADGVAALFDVLRRHVAWRNDAEVTLEANPEDISVEAVRRWRDAGVTRLSIGTQSFDDRVLRWMHRVHDSARARRAIAEVREGGIEAVSLDLIFAAPDGIVRDWDRDLEEAIGFNPDHLSLYGLTVEPHTPLGRRHARGEVTEADELRYEREFLRAHERLAAAGYAHYEVSNYARDGRRARHNSAYWRGVPYLGLGPAAHGFDGCERRWNEPAFTRWASQLKEGHDPRAGREELTGDHRAAESIYLGLRTTDGLVVDAPELVHVAPWVEAGWIEVTNAGPECRVRCTPTGWLRLDALAADLTAFRSASYRSSDGA